jgi:hypothetical protein
VTVRDWLLYALLLLGIVIAWCAIVWVIVRGMAA